MCIVWTGDMFEATQQEKKTITSPVDWVTFVKAIYLNIVTFNSNISLQRHESGSQSLIGWFFKSLQQTLRNYACSKP